MIKITSLRKSFGSNTVLKDISLTVPSGSTTCIIGRSGCGKSVLLKHIVGLLKADSGTVEIDGRQIQTLHRKELFKVRSQIGYVFQGAALFDSLNVYSNVVIGMVERGIHDKAVLIPEAQRVLSAVSLLPPYSERETPAYQHAFTELSAKRPSDLSGGMRKRVGVARALVGNPDYIFYDEPTTGLDPVTSQQIDDLIAGLSQTLNVTSVVITHDMFSIFNVASRVVMIHDGIIWFQGTVPELRNSADPVVVDFLSRYVAEGF